MRDTDFAMFIDAFGEATSYRPVPMHAMEAWRGRLPEQLLSYWCQEGWGSYQHGLFRLIDPADYEDTVQEWLNGTPLLDLDRFHAFACSAFGELFLCGEQCGPKLRLMAPMAAFIALPSELTHKSISERNLEVRLFFSGLEPQELDLRDESGKRLFKRARKQLGDLADDEIYAFEPALCAGGTLQLANLRRLDARVHMSVLRQLEAPSMPFERSVFELVSRRDEIKE